MVVRNGQLHRRWQPPGNPAPPPSATTLGAQEFERALAASRRFLGQWRDAYTRSATEELAQRTLIEIWRSASKLREPGRIEAFARTVARRQRWRGLRRHLSLAVESIEDPDLAELLIAPANDDGCLAVAGRWVARSWLLEQLGAALAELTALNGQLLLGYYEGFNCAELAQRYRLSEDAVKLRLHRSRRRVRRHIESRARREQRDG